MAVMAMSACAALGRGVFQEPVESPPEHIAA
jgi:hypothetical protein